MYKIQRKLYSQNFLRSRKLTSFLVRGSSINKNNLVLEIGPGKGIITEQLIQKAGKVTAVEIDPMLYSQLQVRFKNVKNLTLYQGNFLDFQLPKVSYKVFANIPFSIEGEIIRKLVDAKNPPEDSYLVVMKELAYRLSAQYKENLFSIMHKPWFDFSIFHHFKKTDFTPASNVSSVMLHIKKRTLPLLHWDELPKYRKFILYGFGQGMPVFYNFKKRFGYRKSFRILRKNQVDKKAKPGYLTLKQWVDLYKEFKNI